MLTAGFIIIYYSAGFVCSGQNLQGWIVAYGRDDDVVVAGYPHPSSDIYVAQLTKKKIIIHKNDWFLSTTMLRQNPPVHKMHKQH